MIRFVVGDAEDLSRYVSDGWQLVGRTPLLDGRYRYTLKCEGC